MSNKMIACLVIATLACNAKHRDKDKPAAPAPAPVSIDAAAAAPQTPPAPQPGVEASPKPPSTGKEMPSETVSMTPEQARAVVAKALEAAAAPQPDCDAIADTLMTALPVAYPEVTEDAAPAYAALQKCALGTSRWRAAVQAGVALLPVEHDGFIVAQIVRALAEMGEYDNAIAAAKELAAKYPDAEEPLIEAFTYVYCKAEAWDRCLAASAGALAYYTKQHKPADSEVMVMSRFFRDVAWVVTGKPKPALTDLQALDKLSGGKLPFLARPAQEAQLAIERGFYLDAVPLPQLPTGVYHLMGKSDTGALLTLKLHEHTGKPRHFRVEVEVPGVTERSSNSLVLAAHASTVQLVNPPLKMDFDADKVRSPRPSQLVVKLVEEAAAGDRTIVDETIPIEVLPRDYLPLHRRVGADMMVPTYGYLGAWITSNTPDIETFLAKAKARVPQHQFVGEQDTTVPQVKALFDELKAKGVSYVMDPEVTSDRAFVQRTRLPAEVLASTNAQCLEGTLLFATLMESIGIKPIIVLVPGHAFVGWHTVPKDGTNGDPLFVETTMVGNYSFEQAVQVATQRVVRELKDGNFKTGASTLIDVAQIRKQGFAAQPM